MVIPAITDVTMEAVCPGRDECSVAIYLSGFQNAVSIRIHVPMQFASVLAAKCPDYSWHRCSGYD